MTDTLDYDARAEACAWFAGTLEEKPLRRAEALFVTPDGRFRRLQNELVIELRDAGLSSLARRVERTPIPRGCVLVLLVDTDVSLGVVRLEDEPARRPRLRVNHHEALRPVGVPRGRTSP